MRPQRIGVVDRWAGNFLWAALWLILMCGAAEGAAITTTGSGTWNSIVANAPWPNGTIPAATDTVTIAAGNSVTLTDPRSVGGVTISAGGTLSLSGNTLTDSGAFSNSGTVNGNSGTVRFAGIWTDTGTFNAGTGTVEYIGTGGTSGTSDQIFNTNNDTFFNLTISNTTAANQVSMAGGNNINVTGTMTVSPGATFNLQNFNNTICTVNAAQPQGTLTGAGTLKSPRTLQTTQARFAAYNLSAMTVVFGTGQSTVIDASSVVGSYGGLTVAGGNSSTLSLGGPVTVIGDVTQLALPETLDVTLNNYGITLGGNWNNQGGGSIFQSRTGTVTFNGAGAQSMSAGTAPTTFYNVTLNKPSGSLTAANSSTPTIGGTLTFTSVTDAFYLTGISITLPQVLGNNGGTIATDNDGTTRTVTIGNSTNLSSSFFGVLADANTGIGTLALTQAGAGTLTLGGVNTYTGATMIAGTIKLGVANALPAATPVTMTSGATLELNGFSDTIASLTGPAGCIVDNHSTNPGTSTLTLGLGIYSGVILNTGQTVALTKSGNAGELILGGVNTYSGPTTINSGKVTLSGNGSAVNSAFTINSGATLSLDNSTTRVADRIGDTLPLTMNGGEFTYLGNNNAGSNTETAGALIFNSGSNIVTLNATLSGTNVLTFASCSRQPGATVLFRGQNLGSAPGLNVANILFTNPAGLALVGANTTQTNKPIIPFAIGDITQGGSGDGTNGGMVTYNVSPSNNSANTTGLRVLANATEYTSTIVPGANVRLTGSVALSTTTVNAIYFGTNGSDTGSGILTVSSGLIVSNSTGLTTLAGASSGFSFGGEGVLYLTGNNSSTETIAGPMFGAGGFTIARTSNVGSLTLSADNSGTLSGRVTVNGTPNIATGTTTSVSIAADNNFGPPANTIYLSGGGILQNSVSLNNARATVLGSGGGVMSVTSGLVWNYNGLLSSPAVPDASNGNLTMSGTGMLVLGAHNNYGGTTTVAAAGVLQLGVADGIPNLSALNLASSGSTFDMNGFNVTIGSLTGIVGSIVDNTNATPGTYTLTLGGNNASTIFSGVMKNTSQSVALTKIGSGMFQFLGSTAPNTYSGLTTVTGGILRVSRNSSVVCIPGNLTIGPGGGLVQLRNNEQISNSSDVVINSGGTLDTGSGLTETIRSLVFNTGANLITVSTSNLNFGDASNVGQFTIQGNTSTPAGITLGFGSLTGGITFDASNNGTAVINSKLNLYNVNVVTQRLFTINRGSAPVDMLITGQIFESVGAGEGINKIGNGILKLAASNNYGGVLTLGGGTVIASGSANALGVGLASVVLNTPGTTLELDGDTGLNFGRNVTISADMSIKVGRVTSGAGVTHTMGTLTIGGAPFNLVSGSNVFADTPFGLTFVTLGTVTTNTTFNVANNGAGLGTLALQNFTGSASTPFTTTKQGPGVMTLNGGGNNLIDGTTFNILSGTFISATATSVGTVAAINVADGAAFQIGASQQISSLSDAGSPVLHTGTMSTLVPAASGTNGAFTLTIGNANYLDSTSYSGVIADGSGVLSLLKTGNGTLTLLNSNTYSGGTTIVIGVINIQNNSALGTGTVFINSTSTLQLQGGITVTNPLSLNSPGIASIGGLHSISGSNTWQGTFTLAGASRINCDSGTFTFTATNSITGAQNPTFGGAGNGIVTTRIAVTGNSVVKDGSGTWTFAAANTYTCPTTISGGTLLFNAVNTGVSAVTVNAGGTVGGTGTIPGDVIVNDSGEVAPGSGNTPNGAEMLTIGGQLQLNAGSTLRCYVGPVNFTQIVDARNASASDDVSASTTTPVNIELIDTGVQSGHVYTLVNAIGANGNVNGTTAKFAVSQFLPGFKASISVTATTVSPGMINITPITYATQSLTWTDAAGSNNHNWSNPSNWKVTNGTGPAGPPADGDTVIFDTSVATNSSVVDYTVAVNSLAISQIPVTAPLTISSSNNARLSIGAGGLTTAPSSTTAYTFSTPINLATAQTWNINAGGPVTVSGVVNGSSDASLTKDIGTGTLLLSSANTYGGLTTVNAGILRVTNGSGLGATTLGTVVASGATLDLATNTGFSDPLFLNGAGVGGTAGALTSSSPAQSTQSGPIVLQSATTITGETATQVFILNGGIDNGGFPITFDGSKTVQINCTISGAGDLIKNGPGMLSMFNANTYTGITYINSGTVGIEGNVSNRIPGDVYVGNGTGAPASAILQNLSGSNSIADTATIYLDKTTGMYEEDFDETVANIVDNPRPGAGTGPGSVFKKTGGNFVLNGSASGTLSAKITGAGTLKKNGSGVWTLTSTLSDYSGSIIANGTTGCAINVRTPHAPGAAAVSIFKPCQLQLQDCGTITGVASLTLDQSGPGSDGLLKNISGNNTWPTPLILNTDAATPTINSAAYTLTLSNATATSSTAAMWVTGTSNVFINGVIGIGAKGLLKDGSGMLTLGGANTYTGTTTLSAGTLFVDGSLAAGSALAVAKRAVLRGTGSVNGAATPVAGAYVAPGDTSNATGAKGNLTLGTLNTASGGIVNIRVSNPAAIQADQLTITGSSNVDLSTVMLAVQAQAGSYGSQTAIVLQTTAGNKITKPFPAISDPAIAVTYQNSSNAVVTPDGVNAASFASQVQLTLGSGVTPVTVDSFTARARGSGVLLEWACVSEFQNVGFNLYRQEADGEEWTRVNPALIGGRLTNPDAKAYRVYDWPSAGNYVYKLESVSLLGRAEIYGQLAGPVIVDATSFGAAEMTVEAQDAACGALELAAQVAQTRVLSGAFATPRGSLTPQAQALRPAGSLPMPGGLQPASAASRFDPSIALRAIGMSAPARSFIATKVVYNQPGVLLIPQAALPAGFDLRHVAIQREGRSVTPLALTPGGLLVYGQGYQDDYTDKDALFLRSTTAPTSAGTIAAAHGLFDSALPVSVDTTANVTTEYHDVYFDYTYRPYSFAPWFSSQYLTSGTTQNFNVTTPGSTGSSGILTVNLWSLTQAENVSPDHALQVLVNGMAVGQTEWAGGNKMVQFSFTIPGGVLKDGLNQVALVTPAMDGIDSQICFLHSLSVSYARDLDASKPIQVFNSSGQDTIFEGSNLPSASAWVVDARYPDRAALVPAEFQAQPDGTFKLRFQGSSGGSGMYLVVPAGQENLPLEVSKRIVRPATGGIAYLATGPAQFSATVQPLLALHSKEAIRSAFVDQEQLFDYYNYGRYGPGAIQNAVRSIRPNYLLLLGRTTYDYRNYSGLNIDPLCPTFLVSTSFWAQTTSDSLFGDFGRGFPEVATGRLPVDDANELSIAVSHILNYQGIPASGVRVHAVADKPDPAVADFGAELDTLVKAQHPELTWQENYLARTYISPTEVTAAMKAAANGGADLIMYSGHGNASHLGNEDPHILDQTGVQVWAGNAIFLQATCTANWAAANIAGYKSIAMQALTQPQGGIAAGIGTSTYLSSDSALNFMNQLINNANGSDARWGCALMKAQQWAGAQSADKFYGDVMKTEQLFGDPAMRVFSRKVPGKNQETPPTEQSGTF